MAKYQVTFRITSEYVTTVDDELNDIQYPDGSNPLDAVWDFAETDAFDAPGRMQSWVDTDETSLEVVEVEAVGEDDPS